MRHPPVRGRSSVWAGRYGSDMAEPISTTLISELVKVILIPLKLPFILLNLIPTNVHERVSMKQGGSPRDVTHRETYISSPGSRRLMLGSYLVARARGMVHTYQFDPKGKPVRVIWSADYEDVVNDLAIFHRGGSKH